MNFKELEIKGTYLYTYRHNSRQNDLDNQFYGFVLPFQVNDEVYLIDTYHISHYESYNNFVANRADNITYKYIPYVSDYYYQHYYKINSKEHLERDFIFIGDLEEYTMCYSEFENYEEKDKLSEIPLWHDSRRNNLVKKGADTSKVLKINNLINTLLQSNYPLRLIGKVYKEQLDMLVLLNQTLDYNKSDYEKLCKWWDYLEKISKEVQEVYAEIFN